MISKPNFVAITGGIGSGKSVVSKILKTFGFAVYDCDSKAKLLMDNSDEIKESIATQISFNAITNNGDINRAVLSELVFNSKELLCKLNAIVHTAVLADILKWKQTQMLFGKTIFVETAILYQSGIDKIVDGVWNITAPDNIRIKRVMLRNDITEEQVRARIKAQQHEHISQRLNTINIINDDATPLMPQISLLLQNLK
ncbi:MAG: dephospho-CoA kinase [Bacteroidales bacterium]|nr:dephospho-CoA kinase [Bacteroidales bacterium]